MASKQEDLLTIRVSPDYLTAKVFPTKSYEAAKSKLNRLVLNQILKKYNISHGIDYSAFEKILTRPPLISYPIIIARGTPPTKGKNGEIVYEFDVSSSVDKTEDWNFRDVMRIPSVKRGDILATIVQPTEGQDGIGVNGSAVSAKPGQPHLMKPGQNVEYNKTKQSFYAILDGQVTIQQKRINVRPVYEVHGDLSMETGNVNFVGTVIIHGDVPTGFTVQAGADVKVHGMVEAATIISGGSIYIHEGFAGLQKGLLRAENDIHVGYINQGDAHAKQSILVENSILHSKCHAGKDVFCKRGNIIGGTITAGRLIEARDIGNHLNIKTSINLSIDERLIKQEQQLVQKQEKLQTTLNNLNLIREKLIAQRNKTEQMEQLLRRQQYSYKNTKQNLSIINEQLMNLHESPIINSKVIVHHNLYPNTVISFGKYQRLVEKQFDKVRISYNEREITIKDT